MSAGKYNRWIKIPRKTETSEFGTLKESWPEWDDAEAGDPVPAQYEAVGTREFPEAQKRFSETTCRFKIRYRSGIDPDMNRILFIVDQDASPLVVQIFNIHQPVDGDAQHPRRELVIEADEVK